MALPAHINVHDPASAAANFLYAGQISYRNEVEIRHLAAFIREDDVVLDVGVHLGQYACNFARLAGRSGRVVCVEPLPDQAAFIRSAADALNLPVTVIEAAASDHVGTATIHVPLAGKRHLGAQASLHAHGAETYETFEVPLVRLDDLVADVPNPITFLKIDVEGHELSVLRGATGVIREHRPTLLIEIERRHSPEPIEQTFALLTELGYEGSFLDGSGGSQSLSAFGAEQHQQPDNPQLQYVNNFFFHPARHSPT